MSGRTLVVVAVLIIIAVVVARTLFTTETDFGFRGTRHGDMPLRRVGHMNRRLRQRRRPGPGHAMLWELWFRWGRLAAFRGSKRTRPKLGFWQRTVRARRYSVTVGWAQWRHALRLGLEEHLLIMAGPRTGKSGLLARIVMYFPGAVISTSTKPDIFWLTSGMRERGIREHPAGLYWTSAAFTLSLAWIVLVGTPLPVLLFAISAGLAAGALGVRRVLSPPAQAAKRMIAVFNPQGIGKVLSTFRWNPVDGCTDAQTTIRRASALVRAVPVGGLEGGADFWAGKASAYLQALMCAAAHMGGDLRLVSRWALSDAKDAEDVLLAHAATEVLDKLSQVKEKAVLSEAALTFVLTRQGSSTWAAELGELRSPADKTAASIRMLMSKAVGFMADPALALSVLPAEDHGFDIGEFLAQSGTLYLIAAAQQQDNPLAPLFACLSGEIHYTASQIGMASKGGRLDPPCLFALDEIVNTCPMPVPALAADSGGKGIQLVTVAHGVMQLRSRWKEEGAQTIWDTASAVAILPGVQDKNTLERVSDLCGPTSYRLRGQEHYTEHPVMTPAMIRQMLDGRALFIRRNRAPVIAKLPRAWHDPRYMLAKLRHQDVARLTPAPLPAALPEPTTFADDDAAPVARLRPADVAGKNSHTPELAEVLPPDGDDGVPRPWRAS